MIAHCGARWQIGSLTFVSKVIKHKNADRRRQIVLFARSGNFSD